jgi:hypothetical protein
LVPFVPSRAGENRIPTPSRIRAIVSAIIAFVALAPTPARPDDATERPERWTVTEAMVPMRDGVRLHTKIFVPTERKEPLPCLLLRTPYGIGDAADRLDSHWNTLAADGYIFVFQDIRGKFGSEGVFVMMRPARVPGDTKTLDQGTDTYDTIDWLLRNVTPNNGRVGMLGVSYLGWTTIMGALEPHPALKAISPQASPADMWLGDDFPGELGPGRFPVDGCQRSLSRPLSEGLREAAADHSGRGARLLV